MHTQKTLLAAAVVAFAAFSTTAAAAGPIGDADPGYPGLVHGQIVSTAAADKTTPRMAATRVTQPLVQGEAFNFPEPVGEAKTRAQVRAETLEAIRVGAIQRSERFELPTAEQLESIRLAGLRALDPTVATSGSAAVAN